MDCIIAESGRAAGAKILRFLRLENIIFSAKIMFSERFRKVVQAVLTKNPKKSRKSCSQSSESPLVTDGSLTGGILTKGGF